jgi:hypothetical protein
MSSDLFIGVLSQKEGYRNMAHPAVNLAVLIHQRRKNNESDASSQALIDVYAQDSEKEDPSCG